MEIYSIIQVVTALSCAPLLIGIINRTKALFGCRRGQPLLQPYYEIIKLLQKDYVYSETTSWIFRAGPVVILSTALILTAIIPVGSASSIIAFPGDIILIAYLLGLSRYFLLASSLDTGSSFEAMGASREAQFAILAEPATFLSLIVVAYQTGSISLSGMMGELNWLTWSENFSSFLLVIAALFIVMLAENCRIPFDDPNTHLELTMVHEVMVLDHSGPDLAFILYSSTIKLWLLGSVIINILLPVHYVNPFINQVTFLTGIAGLAVIIGIIESVMARLRIQRVPKLLISASFMAVLALIFIIR
jgi:formate hydrogenlyase subunit 4